MEAFFGGLLLAAVSGLAFLAGEIMLARLLGPQLLLCRAIYSAEEA